MKIYNTLSKRIEEFVPHEDGIVRMYTCGPTVYHYAHIGNLRTYIFEDVLEKTLNYLGYKVTNKASLRKIFTVQNTFIRLFLTFKALYRRLTFKNYAT